MLSVFSEVIAQNCPNDLFISNQGHMANFNIDYPGCTNIPGDVTIYGGGSYLTNLDFLENLTSLRLLRVYDNDFLTSLEGLNNLISLGGGELQVYDNAALTNLNGLDNIDPATITEVILTGSPNLTACEVESICNYLAVPSNLATISGNASGCNTRAEVEAACEVVAAHTINGIEVHIYPNPTTGITNGSCNF
jgi:hypothetical protein